MTLEDPIEYLHKHERSIFNQREIGFDTDSWDDCLQNALRQSPDVVAIGEIRSRNAMEHALAFADTGHLCFSTLHATNASQTIERILSFFPRNEVQQLLYQLSLNLRAILCQRLIPSIDGRRRLATECLVNTKTISDMIKKGDFSDLREIMEKSSVRGMHTFDQSIYRLFKAGQVSEEMALRYADSDHDMLIKIQMETGRLNAPTGAGMHLQSDLDEMNHQFLHRAQQQSKE